MGNKRAFGVVVMVGIAVLALLAVLIDYRPETFMSENQVLSKEFSTAYMGPSFDVLRSKCWERSNVNGSYQKWTINYHQDNISVELDSSDRNSNPCLVYASKNPALVIKKNGSSSGYTVMTTGEEKEMTYSPELIKKLLSAVDAGNTEVQRQKKIIKSWDTAH